MLENGKERFILTKSYEIAYAIFRIAGPMQEKDFAERLRSSGGALLQAAAVQDGNAARVALQTIECLVKFAGDVSLMSPANSDVLLREVYVLDAAVIERINAAKSDAVNLAEIFSKQPEYRQPSGVTMDDFDMAANAANAASAEAAASVRNAAVAEPEREDARTSAAAGGFGGTNAGGNMKAEMRQSAIMERIRQSGNCRIKDLQDILPDCSERTIRYDLQSLVEKNLIERMGAGGPAVYYRMRQNVPQEFQGAAG